MAAETFQLRPEKTYRLFGAQSESAIPNGCPFCGGGFEGPLQTNCPYCGTQRSAFMIEVPKGIGETSKSTPKPTILLPETLTSEVTIGTRSKRAWVEAQKVIIGRKASVAVVEADEITIDWNVVTHIAIARLALAAGWDFRSGTVMAPQFETSGYFHTVTLVTKDGRIGEQSKIKDLWLLPEGKLTVFEQTEITNLYIGERAGSVYLGKDSTIRNVYSAGKTEIDSAPDSQVLRETKIDPAAFGSGLKNALREVATQRRTVVALD